MKERELLNVKQTNKRLYDKMARIKLEDVSVCVFVCES